jgi:hypothetical protein
MRGKRSATPLAVLVSVGVLAMATPAGATITPDRNAADVASAIGAAPVGNVAPDFDLIPAQSGQPPSIDPVATSTTSLPPFPFAGAGPSYAILSTGDAKLVDIADQEFFASADDHLVDLTAVNPPRGNTAHDATVLRIPINVPVGAGLNCLSFDFRFLSEEYPDFIQSQFNDAFIAELLPRGGVSTWTTSGSEITGVADHDFALDPNGKPVTIKSTGPTSMSPAEAAGTPFGGATAPLRAQVAVSEGQSYDLVLSIFDQGDQAYDTVALVDNLQLRNVAAGGCQTGSVGLGPAVVITGPPDGGKVDTPTPTLTGTTNGSTSTVTVRIYRGRVATGTPVQTLTAARSGSSWSVVAGPLDPDDYTAQASQANAQGINGISGPVLFTVVEPQAPQPQPQGGASLPRQQQVGDRDGDGIPDNLDNNDGSRPPVPGKSVQVRVVSGQVFVKYPAGSGGRATGPPKGFVPLEGAANIPMGSQLDTAAGRVALTSAADTGGVKTQTSDFYDGIFQVKQTVPKKKPNKPAALITDLVLKGASASQCAPLKGASAAVARKKKGPKSVLNKLWGNGKGKFRTSGKYSSATVRGTIWLTQDECDGTLTKVARGTVQVRDFKLKKTVTVKAGHSYLARAQRAASKAKRRIR